MPNNGDFHLSASARKLQQMAQQLAQYETMRSEYALLLHYLVSKAGGVYLMPKAELQSYGPPRTIRSEVRLATEAEILDGIPEGLLIEYRLMDTPPDEKPRIIVPG